MIAVYHLEKFVIMRDAIRSLITKDLSIAWAGDSNNHDGLLKELAGLNVDVILMDIESVPHCLEFCQALFTLSPTIKIILHTPYKRAAWISKFLNAGVTGFVSKNSGTDELLLAIHTVHKGCIYVCPVISEEFIYIDIRLKDKGFVLKESNPGFSNREIEIIDLLTKGYSTKDIAAKLFLSDKTIESHRKNIITKANVKNTPELMQFVLVNGLLVN